MEEYGTVENAIAELTGTGEKIHKIDEAEDEASPTPADQFAGELVNASEDGSRGREFERLVAEAFSRLGFEAQWIEGGGDTDVEITSPIHAIVEAKARGSSRGIVNMNASRIAKHRDQHGAEYGFVVGRYFPPGSIEDAERNELTTITSDALAELLSIRDQYGVPPEVMMEILGRPGGVQDDRLDQLDEYIQERIDAMETVREVLEALARGRDIPKDASALQNIILGMSAGTQDLPNIEDIQQSIDFLSYSGIGLLEMDDDGYRLKTNYKNAVKVLESLDGVFIEVFD